MISCGENSGGNGRTRTHFLMSGVVLLAAVFSFLPITVGPANAVVDGCSEVDAGNTSGAPFTCPDAPTNVSVQATDHGTDVTWDAVIISGAQNSQPTVATSMPNSFEVRVTPGDVMVKVSAPAHTASVIGLVNGKEYKVSVLARNEFGASTVVGPFAVTPTSGVDGDVGQLIVKYKDGVDATQSRGIATGSDGITGLELTPVADLGRGIKTLKISESVSNEAGA